MLNALNVRWGQLFSSMATGDDVPPALQLRTEGLMEAAVIIGIAGEVEIQSAMSEQYAAASGRTIEEDFGDQWRTLFPFPQIPVVMLRAPVYPSTRD